MEEKTQNELYGEFLIAKAKRLDIPKEEKERIIKIGKENTKRREEEKKEKYSSKVFASKKPENNVIEKVRGMGRLRRSQLRTL